MASLLAASMNPQVLTTPTSASAMSSVISQPAARSRASMCSLSTRFLAQPSEISPIFGMEISFFVPL